jgi:CubicO group peptidase (beta-lactamase class C family)
MLANRWNDIGYAALLFFLAWIGSAQAQEARGVPAERAWTVPSNDHIRQLLAERMHHNGVGIVVGVIEPAGRRVVAYGRRGFADAREVDGDTVFQIGSVTKVFTTLVLADMVLRGEVALNDPASMYLPPGVDIAKRGQPITLLDLATHTSGLPSMPTNFALDGEPDPYEAYSVEQLHEFLSSHQLEREPGTKWQYSNLGVALLGRLLARRAGMGYEALVAERVLEPLAMGSTAITLKPDLSQRLAPGHDRYLKPVDTWDLVTLPGSGALRSTVNDLLTFLAANLGYEDAPLKAAIEYQRSVRVSANGASQALGWLVVTIGDVEVIGHDGGKEGYRAGVIFSEEPRAGVVVLANARTDDRPMAIALHLLTGRPLPPAPPVPPARNEVMLERGVLDAYAGRYQLSPSTIVSVARKDSHLLVDFTGGGVVTFFAEGSQEFLANTEDEQIGFQVDAAGLVTGLMRYERGRKTLAPRIEGNGRL